MYIKLPVVLLQRHLAACIETVNSYVSYGLFVFGLRRKIGHKSGYIAYLTLRREIQTLCGSFSQSMVYLVLIFSMDCAKKSGEKMVSGMFLIFGPRLICHFLAWWTK